MLGVTLDALLEGSIGSLEKGNLETRRFGRREKRRTRSRTGESYMGPLTSGKERAGVGGVMCFVDPALPRAGLAL